MNALTLTDRESWLLLQGLEQLTACTDAGNAELRELAAKLREARRNTHS